MKHVRGGLLLAGLALLLMVTAPTWAADDKPVAMSEVGRMLDKDQTPQDVVAAMAARGVSFRMSKTAQRRLEKWGFTEAQIELIKKIAAGEKVQLEGKPDEPAPDGDADGDGDADVVGEEDKPFEVGYPNADHWHKAEQARIERAIKAAGLGYKRIELTRCTLYCSDSRARTLVPMLRKLEADLIKRFPESIPNASSPQSAHIVIVDGDSAWRNWVTACFDSYEEDGIRFRFGPEDDPRPQLIAGSGYMLPSLSVTHADKKPSEEAISRFAAFSVGYLMMEKAGGGAKQPDGLKTGFGDLAEAMAHRTPSVMLYSYEERDLGEAESWKGLVAQRFKDKKIKSVTAPWSYDTSDMDIADYAACWSLVSTLAAAPDKFAEAVALVREEDKKMGTAVSEVYKLEDRKLLEAWYRFVSQ